ncbi:rhodanese-like domain-containing protein [Cohnella thailandensis]|uniref:Rhodanese-like domain-containing protein n=1 Tax=Cohnella thailandensis TaxID=557557 RepID=A0A841SYS2_9BACL|nr:rhodanese-like domain-containing protein [Cohnella thailandensis]MBB6636412.1 rhodanese-like domain-containing protein [Cohnella thailandensis]MBP1973617.1 rhodanese-related sulfurtransferase [Cohnella thailandensis]
MSSYDTTTVEQLKARLDAGEKLHLIDVREDDEVAYGMIDGAVHIPMGQIPERLADIPKDEEVIFICRSGNRSGRVCEYLAAQGFGKTVNMLGGMLAWDNL